MIKHRKSFVVLGALVLAASARAAGDLDAVVTGITTMQTAVIAAVAGVITAGLALMAVKFGGRWLIKVFKTFSS